MRLLSAFVFLAASLVAADLTGKWDFAVETSAGSGSPKFDLVQQGEQLTGKYAGQLGEAEVKGTVKGDKVEIRFSVDAGALVYAGTVQSDGTLKGTVDIAGGQASGTFTAKRAAK